MWRGRHECIFLLIVYTNKYIMFSQIENIFKCPDTANVHLYTDNDNIILENFDFKRFMVKRIFILERRHLSLVLNTDYIREKLSTE